MRNTTHTTRRGMTLLELLLAMAVIGTAMGVLVAVSESLRIDNAQARTRATLAVLRSALVQYHQHQQRWPEAGDAAGALQALLDHEATAHSIRRLLHAAGGSPDSPPTVLDGYGRAIAFVSASDSASAGPDFVSPGPDGRLGDPTSDNARLRSDAADNLYGSDMETIQP